MFMMKWERIASNGALVKVTTNKNDIFIGTLLPIYNIVNDNNRIVTEIFLSQHPSHKGEDFGCVGLFTSDIANIKVLESI